MLVTRVSVHRLLLRPSQLAASFISNQACNVAWWHIASFRCRAGFGRNRSVKDLGERSARQIYEFTLSPPRPAPAHTPRSPDKRPPSDHRASPIPPDGQMAHASHAKFARRANVPHADALAASGKSSAHFRPSCGLAEGVSRSSRTLAVGCDGRGLSDRRSSRLRTEKSCGSGAPTLALSSRRRVGVLRATGARKPGPREEHEGHR
jgi:hypothetical protein